MARAEDYNELEFMVLAMVDSGLTSGYAIRRQIQRMRGVRWSAESGSVYRVLRRLEKDLLITEDRRVGVPNRERTEYSLLDLGRKLLQDWLTTPLPQTDLELLVDPMRMRMHFLGKLDATERRAALEVWMKQNKRLIQQLERELETTTGPAPKIWAEQNLLALAKARQDWLKKLLTAEKGEKATARKAISSTVEVLAVTS